MSSINATFEESRCLAISPLSESINDLKNQRITWEGVSFCPEHRVFHFWEIYVSMFFEPIFQNTCIFDHPEKMWLMIQSVINGGHIENHIYFAWNLFCFIYSFSCCNQGEILLWPFEMFSSTPPFMHHAFCVTFGLNFSYDPLQTCFLFVTAFCSVARTALVCIFSNGLGFDLPAFYCPEFH